MGLGQSKRSYGLGEVSTVISIITNNLVLSLCLLFELYGKKEIRELSRVQNYLLIVSRVLGPRLGFLIKGHLYS